METSRKQAIYFDRYLKYRRLALDAAERGKQAFCERLISIAWDYRDMDRNLSKNIR